MRPAFATLWIMVGCVLTATVYWAFLITPESTVWALIMSAMLAVAALALVGLTATGAVAIAAAGIAGRFGIDRRGRSLNCRRRGPAADNWGQTSTIR